MRLVCLLRQLKLLYSLNVPINIKVYNLYKDQNEVDTCTIINSLCSVCQNIISCQKWFP